MNEQTKCEQLIAHFSDYLDGSLDETLCVELEQHLQGCQNCRIVVNTLQQTIEIYHDAYGNLALPEDLRRKLFHRLNLKENFNP
jgi:anti-sigma factor (TIGR02949 family)